MSSSAVVIGSYCSDFTVANPTSASDFCFYVAETSGGGQVYLASNTVTKNTPSPNADQLDDIKIIPSTFYMPNDGTLTESGGWSEWFKELKFRPIWSPTITGDFSATPVTPADERRFLSSAQYPTVITTEDNRFVRLNAKNNNNGGFKFSGSAVTSIAKLRPPTGTTKTSSSTGFTDTELPNLTFTPTNVSPVRSTASQRGVYMVVKSDWDKRTEAVGADKQLRYLVHDGIDFRLLDLYDPDVSESTIKSCYYRITSGTQITLLPSGTIVDATVFNNATKATNWGMKAYVPLNALATIPAGTAAATAAVPNLKAIALGTFGASASAVNVAAVTIAAALNANEDDTSVGAIDVNLALFGNSTGTGVGVFRDPNDTVYTDATLPGDSTLYTTNGLNGQQMVIPSSFQYYDHTNGLENTKNNAKTTGTLTIQFVTEVFDKRVEELFSNVNVTLLRLVQPSSGVLATSPAAGDNNNYLGLEHVIPTNSVTVDPGSSVTSANVYTPATTATGIGLIVRDYFKFYNPARATQFKFYDLGNKSEYIWQANFQAGASNAYAYVTVDSATDKIQLLTRITDQNQRGWILEYDNTMTPPGVRLKWAATGKYVDVNKNTGTDSAPMRIDSFNSGSATASITSHTLTATKSSAAIFNCIVCSSIDASGACRVPTNIDSMSGTLPNARTTPVGAQVSISSPTSPALIADSPAFRLRAGSNYIRYALSQFGSATSPVMSGGADMSPSPVPDDPYISEFILTQQGGVMSDTNRTRRAFFIKAANMPSGQNYYLRVDPNTGNVRMVETNLPSDMEGYAWLLIYVTGTNVYNLVSVPLSVALTATNSIQNRYLTSAGSAIASATVSNFTYEPITGSNTLGTDLVNYRVNNGGLGLNVAVVTALLSI